MFWLIGSIMALYFFNRQRSGYTFVAYSGQEKADRINRTLVFANTIASIALEYKVDPAVIASIIAVESEGIPCKYARASNDTYYGLMGLGYKTAQWQGYAGRPYSTAMLECPPMTGLFIPDINIRYGTKYFAYQYNRYKSPQYAISAYQQGSLKYATGGQMINMGYVKTVLNFVPDFRLYFRGLIPNYDTLYPPALWDPAVSVA